MFLCSPNRSLFIFFNYIYIYKSANVTQLEGAAPCGCRGGGEQAAVPPSPKKKEKLERFSPSAGSCSRVWVGNRTRVSPGGWRGGTEPDGDTKGGSPGPAGLGGAGGRCRGAGTRRREVPPVPAFVWLGAAPVAPADDIATGGRLATVVAVGWGPSQPGALGFGVGRCRQVWFPQAV